MPSPTHSLPKTPIPPTVSPEPPIQPTVSLGPPQTPSLPKDLLSHPQSPQDLLSHPVSPGYPSPTQSLLKTPLHCFQTLRSLEGTAMARRNVPLQLMKPTFIECLLYARSRVGLDALSTFLTRFSHQVTILVLP